MLLISPFVIWIRRHLSKILFGIVVLVVLGMAASYLSFNLMVPQKEDPDEGVYLMVARLLNAGYSHDSFSFDQFWMFPEVISLAFRLFGDSLEVGRGVVVVFSLAGLLGMVILARQLGAGLGALLAILCGVIEPYYLAQSRVAMSNVPGVVCVVWAAVGMAKFCRRDQRVWLVLSGALVGAALVIKPLTVAFAGALGTWLILHRTQWKEGRPQVKLRDLSFDFAVFAAPAILMAAPFVNFADLPSEFRRTVFAHWLESRHYTPGIVERLGGVVNFIGRNFMWLPFAAAGILRGMRRAPGLTLALVSGELLSAALLLQFTPWDDHYTLLSPILIVFAVVGIDGGIAMFKQRFHRRAEYRTDGGMLQDPNKLIAAACRWGTGVWLLALPWLVYNNLNVLNEPRNDLKTITAYLKHNTAPGSYVLSDNAIIVYSADRLMPPSAMNLPFESTFGLPGYVRDELETVITRYPVIGIVLTSNYAQDPQLISWIRTKFPASKLIPGDSLATTAHVFSRNKQRM